VSDSWPPAAARVFFAAGIAAAGGNARSKKTLANHRRVPIYRARHVW